MVRRILLLTLVVCFFGEPVLAQKRHPADDLPMAANLEESGTSSSVGLMSIMCSRVDARSASCWFSQTWLRPPDPKRIKQEIAEARKQSLSDWKKSLVSICKNVSDAGSTHPTFVAKLNAACSRKDLTAVRDAVVWFLENVKSRTCSMQLLPPHSMVFEQLDANTWQSVNRGICATTVSTLFRADSDAPWEYKQVRSVVPNRKSSLCDALTENTMLWSWRSKKPRTLQCSYVEY